MAHAPLAEVAVAIFVKTPGRSPAKTRLAAEIGAVAAAGCYERCLAVVEEVVATATARLPGMVPYWAVAESEGLTDPRWGAFALVGQGDGSLGHRLDRVYLDLLERHGAAVLLGADCPLLSPEDLLAAAGALRRGEPFVIGRAADGGYYLFGGRSSVPRDTWLAVPYSASDTAERFMALLGGRVAELPELPDVDVAADLAAAARHPRAAGRGLLPAQHELLQWLAASGLD
ncbi:MAG: DUF2064 domain-containing protein [Gemmatimonadetes bacterium]|jgi:glycosyltransferase A (GT-A) superfamily protein (DUF2064 family)|nr:DUF2064 domain-containing protein [Gemmatimonadota bacterium]MBP9201336.1 DUF2064 domain-containing protein [Gemmatimonadales bacterium]MBK6779641.1 DUF2064 domain-containing protein [Gemmatimonadota bacterium]MBK7350365.1 DUF2064 domain-containing protein [Gemmatimonadota bacterium]MBK7716382.1 DUF2064 domain-containing protein [Gemmatimonadota bacterium]